MTTTEKLTKIIEKAIENGWDLGTRNVYRWRVVKIRGKIKISIDRIRGTDIFGDVCHEIIYKSIPDFIASDAMKVLFPGKEHKFELKPQGYICKFCKLDHADWGGNLCDEDYQYYRQQVIILEGDEAKINYLYKQLFEK